MNKPDLKTFRDTLYDMKLGDRIDSGDKNKYKFEWQRRVIMFLEMLSYKKGDKSEHRPEVGENCLLSPPNCDDDNGYVYFPSTCIWADETFGIFKNQGKYPEVYKWEHIRCKKIPPIGDVCV